MLINIHILLWYMYTNSYTHKYTCIYIYMRIIYKYVYYHTHMYIAIIKTLERPKTIDML